MRKGYVNHGRRGWGRNEVRLGRMIRDGEGHPAGVPGADNAGATGGNSGAAGNSDSGGNNDGQAFDATSFWNSPEPNADGSSNDGSANGGDSASGNGGDQGGNFAEQLTTQLNGLSFGEPLLNAEIAEQINNGDFTGFEKRATAMMQQTVRHALSMNVQILRPLAEQILQQVDQKIQSTLSGRDDSDALLTDFPAARDPKVAPMIRQVFNQALKNTKGDRKTAVSQTKEMIALMTNTAAGDLGLNVAPRGSDDSGRPAPVTNWLDELTGR